MDKQQIAKAFGKKASEYDTHARVQKYVGHRLLTLLSEQSVDSAHPLLDLGTGSGFFLPDLKRFAGEQSLVAADLSEGMIRHVQSKHGDLVDACVVADAEALPFSDASLSAIFSSMAIQWCDDLDGLMKELTRVVKPGGWIAFSTLMPDTLIELKDAWHQVDQRDHVNHFLTAQEITQVLQKHGSEMTCKTERVVASYPDVKALLHSIKGIGANTVNEGSKPMTKGQLRALTEAYESVRNDSGFLPASYDVFYGVLQVPAN